MKPLIVQFPSIICSENNAVVYSGASRIPMKLIPKLTTAHDILNVRQRTTNF